MGGACCLHDTGVQKLTLNMLCSFLTSPGEGRPQHNITIYVKNKIKYNKIEVRINIILIETSAFVFAANISLLQYSKIA